MSNKVEDYVLTIPDFPEKGIMFRDISTVLESPEGFRLAIEGYKSLLEGVEFDAIAGAESRGFMFGAPLAYALGKPFLLIRKAGKLPRETESVSYDLEYGSATIEMHKSSVKKGDRIVVVDDLIATGGTMKASCELIEKLGGKVAKIIVLIELEGLKGRDLLKDYDLGSVVKYPGK